MKRRLSSLSDEIESVATKRTCLLVSTSTEFEEIVLDELDSPSEHDDDDIIEIEDINHICRENDNTIMLVSDDDQDIEIVGEEIQNELIDLTDDEPISTCIPFECESSIDEPQCPICLEGLSHLQSIGVYLIITPCRHVMCTLCSRQLLITSARCPLCRENVSSKTLMPYCILT